MSAGPALGLVIGLALFYWLARPLPSPKVLKYTQLTKDARRKLSPPDSLAGMVTDGARLYFLEIAGGEAITLAEVSTSGGETALVPTPFSNVALWDIAPDRSQLLVSSFSGLEPELSLWTLPLPAGTPRRLGEVVGHEASWSPDQQHIVYARGTNLYLANSDGTGARKLTTVSGLLFWPAGRQTGRSCASQ